MAKKPIGRRALRLSRPEPERFFTVMIVFSHRTLRWSIARRTLTWGLGIAIGVWAVAMIGSAYGFWATKKIMSFSALQRETAAQAQQLRDSLEQARGLEEEVSTLRLQVKDLLRILDPKNPDPVIPPMPLNPGTNPAPSQPTPQIPGATHEKLSYLKQELDRIGDQAKSLRVRMDPIIVRWNHTPSIPPTAGYLSSSFGIRVSPFSRVNEEDAGLLGYHSGYDITNQEGTPVQSTADGKVVSAGWQNKYGLTVVVRHSDEYETLYAHLSKIHVQEGKNIVRGEILGDMGRTGNATGVHLHYEVKRYGQPVNPKPYLRLQRQWLGDLK